MKNQIMMFQTAIQEVDYKQTSFNIENKEIFRAGKLDDNRAAFTDEDVLSVYKGTQKRLKEGFKIPIVLGHRGYNIFGNNTEKENIGFISRLKRRNGSIYADFRNIPEEIYAKIQNERLYAMSPEIVISETKEGKTKYEYIDAIAFLGESTPAIPKLYLKKQPIQKVNLDKEVLNMDELKKLNDLILNLSSEVKHIKEGLKTDEKENNLLKLSKDIEKLKNDITEKDKKIESLSAEVKSNEEAKKQLDEITQKAKDMKLEACFEDAVKLGLSKPTEKEEFKELFSKSTHEAIYTLLSKAKENPSSLLTTEVTKSEFTEKTDVKLEASKDRIQELINTGEFESVDEYMKFASMN